MKERRFAAPRRALPAGAAATLVAAAIVLLATGVNAWELIRYGLYELVFVLVPGTAAYLALFPRPGGPVRVVALGWTLGMALVLFSFALTAALGVRGLLWAYPVVVLAATVPFARRHSAAIAWEDAPSPAVIAAGVGAIAIALVYLVGDPFIAAPLPEHAASVEYYADNVWDIGLIADAMHHWPPGHPSVAGLTLRYHLFAFLDMAATANVAGVSPSTLVLRLFPVSMTVLTFVLITCLGRKLSGRWGIGVLAGALLFLTGEIDLFPRERVPFIGLFAESTWESPTYLFGLVFFLAAALVVCDALGRRERPTARDWTLLVVLLAAGVGAKASVAPVLLGGLVLTAAWCALRYRDRLRLLLTLSGVVLAVFVVGYVVVYSGGSGTALELKPFDVLQFTLVETRLPQVRGQVVLEALLSGPTILAGTFALLGIVWMFKRPRMPLAAVFLLALLAASLVPTLLLADPSAAQLYFLLYGVPPALVVAAAGLGRFWTWATTLGMRPRRFVVAAGAVLAIAAAGAAWSWTYNEITAIRPVLLVYVVALIAIVIAAVAVAPKPRRFSVVLPIAAALSIVLAAADRPLDTAPVRFKALKDGVPMNPVDQPDARGTTRALTEGLRWVRDHTSDDAELAVNVHARMTGGDSRYFYYSALAERRIFLESWAYTPAGADGTAEQVYSARLALNDGALISGNLDDLRALRRRGVDYALVDRVHGAGSPVLDTAADRVFANSALIVYRLRDD